MSLKGLLMDDISNPGLCQEMCMSRQLPLTGGQKFHPNLRGNGRLEVIPHERLDLGGDRRFRLACINDMSR